MSLFSNTWVTNPILEDSSLLDQIVHCLVTGDFLYTRVMGMHSLKCLHRTEGSGRSGREIQILRHLNTCVVLTKSLYITVKIQDTSLQ